jgi:hypothetical protein
MLTERPEAQVENNARRTCVFCGGPADSREHVFAKRLCERAQAKTLTVTAGTYTEGQGLRLPRPDYLLEGVQVRHVCTHCNNGWMNDLEAWFEERLGFLIEPDWPRLAVDFVGVIRPERQQLALWMLKTAIMFNFAAVKGSLKVEFPADVMTGVGKGHVPDYCWIDLGFSHFSTPAGGQIGRTFRTVASAGYDNAVTYKGFGFRFLVQFNHLLLRIALAPSAEVCYDQWIGVTPARIYPEPTKVISIPAYPNHIAFEDALVLRTWKGCRGNVPRSCRDLPP